MFSLPSNAQILCASRIVSVTMLLFCFRFLGLGVNTQNPGGLTIVNTNSYKINGVPSPVKGKIMLLV